MFTQDAVELYMLDQPYVLDTTRVEFVLDANFYVPTFTVDSNTSIDVIAPIQEYEIQFTESNGILWFDEQYIGSLCVLTQDYRSLNKVWNDHIGRYLEKTNRSVITQGCVPRITAQRNIEISAGTVSYKGRMYHLDPYNIHVGDDTSIRPINSGYSFLVFIDFDQPTPQLKHIITESVITMSGNYSVLYAELMNNYSLDWYTDNYVEVLHGEIFSQIPSKPLLNLYIPRICRM